MVADKGREIPQADFLEDIFGLTPAQARLVVQLFAGASLRSCAEKLGIKYESARGYLKAVFEKTGTHRQAELVLTIFQAMSDPAMVPAAIAARKLRTTSENGRGAPIYPFGGYAEQNRHPQLSRVRRSEERRVGKECR